MANATTNAILDNLRARLPGVTDDVAKLELFNTVTEVAREALRTTAPSDVDAEPDTWLSSALWVPNYQVILEGTLFRLYAQVHKPWFNGDLAKIHSDRYMVLLGLARSDGAAAPTTVYERILYTLRAKIPLARDTDLTNAIYSAVNKVRVDALNLAALQDSNTTPTGWLASDKWDECYQAVLYGSLAHLYAEVGRPWAAPEIAVANLGQFGAELALLRGSELTTVTTYYDRLISTVRAAAPMARENVIKLASYEVADKIRVDALNLAAINDPASTPTTWLPTDKWASAFRALLRGTLAQVFGQPGQPWSAPELAAANEAMFQQELSLLRTDELASPATLYARLVNTVRVQAPLARDTVVKLAAFAVANKIRVDALNVAPLLSTDTDPTTWLPSDKWDEAYNALLYGTLSRVLGQTGQPWSAPEIAAANEGLFQQELSLLRVDELANPTTLYGRLVNAVLAQAPTARAAVVKLATFAIANKIRIDALGVAPLLSTDTDPTTWLPSDKWDEAYNALFYGTLARVLGQTGQPWAAPELAAANEGLFQQELSLLRSDELASPATLYARLVNTVRAQLPTARESVVKLAIFAIADKIRLDALRLSPLTDTDTTPTSWLPTDKWDDCYQALLYGTLSRLQMQAGQPWAAPDAATANQALFTDELILLRGDDASAPATVFDRLVSNIRVKIPGLRDGVIKLEIYNTVDKIRREALRLAPLTDANTTPSGWLPSDKWDDCYQVVLHGTLARLYSQAGAAWSNGDMAAAQFALYQTELELVRNETASSRNTDMERLLDMARVRLPGARDNIILVELFATMNEFFQNSSCWTEEVRFKVAAGKKTYEVVTTSPSTIVRLMSLTDANGGTIAATMPEPGLIVLARAPDKEQFLTAELGLTVADPVDRDGYPEFPDWFLTKYANDILDGLLGRMMSQLAKPYSQPQLAQFHMRRFTQAVSRAGVEANHGNLFRAQRWSFPQTFTRRKARW